MDVLAELEKIRRQALGTRPGAPQAVTEPGSPSATSPNGAGEIHREIQLTVPLGDFRRARRFTLRLQVEDAQNNVVDAVRDQVEIDDIASLNKVLLRLNVALNPED